MSIATGQMWSSSCAISSPACLIAHQSPLGGLSCQCRQVCLVLLCVLEIRPVLLNSFVGNTVYIGLGLAAPTESLRWIKSGVSLISFCVGSFCFSRFHRYFMPSRRWVLCTSFILQMTLIVIAASILTWVPKSQNETHWTVLVPIALVAFQSCGQAVVSRALKYNALTSVVLTSIYCDLFSDAELFAVHNPERNRRVGAPVLLLFGAVMGGLLTHTVLKAAGVLWIAAGLKLLVVIAWFLWPAADE
jgi:uncharacterized membrane protein YoaK (UPF0700 family)